MVVHLESMVKDMSDITNGLKVDTDKVGVSLDDQQRVSNKFDTVKDNVQEDFSTLFKINKLVKGLNGIKRENSKVSDEIVKIALVNQRHTENLKYIDIKLSNRIEELEVPHDYLVTDSMETNYYDVVSLNKEDGVSINKGDKSLTEASLNTDTSIEKENLINLTTEETVKQTADEIENIDYIDLVDVGNNNELDKQTIEDEYNTRKINMENIDNNELLEVVKLDDSNFSREVEL